jgi:hypothetical protein
MRSAENDRGDGGSLSIALVDARGWRKNQCTVLSHSFQVELDGLADGLLAFHKVAPVGFAIGLFHILPGAARSEIGNLLTE